MATALSNHFKYQVLKKAVDLSADTIKVILMATGFTFNKDSHAVYSDISGSELATGNGYTADTKTLSGQTLTEDDTNDYGVMTCSTVEWTASGGSIGPTPGAVLYSDTSSDNTIIGYIDFGSDKTTTNGNIFQIVNIQIRVA